jgi:hypothetical protein
MLEAEIEDLPLEVSNTGGVVVADARDLVFASSDFDVTDGGGGAANVALAATITSAHTWSGPQTYGATITMSAMTQGSIVFAGVAGLLSQNNSSLFWDNANHSVQISQPSGTISNSGRCAFTNALGPGAVGEYLVKVTPDPLIAPGNKNFNQTITAFGNIFGVRNNIHFKYGYNMSRTSTGAEDTSDPAVGLCFESYYRPSSGQILTEGYFQYWPQGGGVELQRPFMFNVNQVNNFMTTYFGSDDFQWTATATGNVVARLTSANLAFVLYDGAVNQRVILDAQNGQVRVNATGSASAALTRNFHAEGTNVGLSVYDTGAGVNAHLWDFYATGGQWNFRAINDAASAATDIMTVTRTGIIVNMVKFPNGNVDIGTGGLTLNSPTGGDKGAGTINVAGDIYKNNLAYTNPKWVLQRHYLGLSDREGLYAAPKEYGGLMHLEAHREITRSKYDLPLMLLSPKGGMFERGDLMLASLEEAYLYIYQLHDRIKALETIRTL